MVMTSPAANNGHDHSLQEALFIGASLETQITSKCNLFHLLIIHTPEAIPHGMVHPITAVMLERFQNLNKTSQPNHSYQSM